jgi:hypothetical protein
MMGRSLLAAFATLCLLAVTAGCGAASDTGAGAASIAPASAKAVVEVDGNLDSDQWQAALDLVDRFPDGDKLLDELHEAGDAVGDQVFIVVLDEDDAVALTQPDDAAELEDFVEEYDLVSREIEGWTAISEDEEALDAYARALDAGTLEGNALYEAASDTFPDEALATLYARGETASEWTGLAVTAEDDGFRLSGHLKTTEAHRLQPIDQAALDQVPGDAMAVLAFGGGDFAANLPDEFGAALSQIRPLADALGGGAVVWVSPGIPFPSVTAILPNGNAMLLDGLLPLITGEPTEDTQLDGLPAKSIRAGGPITVTYADVDGRLVITTGTSLHGSGGFQDDDGFNAARDKVGLPDDASAFLYGDVQRISALVNLLGATGAVPPEVSRNLEHLDWVYLAAGGQGTEQEIGAFLAIE